MFKDGRFEKPETLIGKSFAGPLYDRPKIWDLVDWSERLHPKKETNFRLNAGVARTYASMISVRGLWRVYPKRDAETLENRRGFKEKPNEWG